MKVLGNVQHEHWLIRKSAWILFVAAMALSWAQSGRTQAVCHIDRGRNPLDVVTVTASPYVYFVLDTSGSMALSMDGRTFCEPGEEPREDVREDDEECSSFDRWDEPERRDRRGNLLWNGARLWTAKRVIGDIINDPRFENPDRTPAINWGFVNFSSDNPGPENAVACSTNQDNNQCAGLDKGIQVDPPTCTNRTDPRPEINRRLRPSRDGGIRSAGGTPNGVSIVQAGKFLRDKYLPTLQDGQKIYMIYLTDGGDTCECGLKLWDGTPTTGLSIEDTPENGYERVDGETTRRLLRGQRNTSAFTHRLNHDTGLRPYNFGVAARRAYRMIDPGRDGKTGEIYMIGMAFARDAVGQVIVNHAGWEASGVSDGRAGHPAYFADDYDALKDAILNILTQVSAPAATFSTGAPVVGTVKGLIPRSYSGVPTSNAAKVTADRVYADTTNQADYGDAKTVVRQNRDNVVITPFVKNPGWEGHVVARRVWDAVPDPSTGVISKRGAFEKVWDAGERLRDRDPASRRVYFNRLNESTRRSDTNLQLFNVRNVLPQDVGFDPATYVRKSYLGANTAEDARDIVVKTVLGYRLIWDPVNGPYRDGDDDDDDRDDDDDDDDNDDDRDGDRDDDRDREGDDDRDDDRSGTLNWDRNLRNWKLFDSTGEGPALIGTPQASPDDDYRPKHHLDEYRRFYDSNFNRSDVVYIGTNGGLMHAIDGVTGDELFAVVTDDLMRYAPGETPGSHALLKDFVADRVTGRLDVANHKFLMSAAASAEDVWLDGRWRTVLTFGRGGGGGLPGSKFYTALDITNVGNWDPSYPTTLPAPAQDPKMLFNVGNREGLNDRDSSGETYDALGETWSMPVVGDVGPLDSEGAPQPVVFAGSGYGCASSSANEGRSLYVFRLTDGTILRRFPVADPPSRSPNAVATNALVATPTVFNPSKILKGATTYVTTAVYFPDLYGRIFRLDTTNANPALWPAPIVFASLGTDQPISAQLALLAQPDRTLVFPASGGDYRVDPQNSGAVNFQVTGFIDDGSGPGTPIKSMGPFQTLATGERVFAAPLANYSDTVGTVFFASVIRGYVPQDCAYSFRSTLYAFSASNGMASFDLSPDAGSQPSLDLGAGSVTGLFNSSSHLYVAKSGGLGTPPSITVFGEDRFDASDDYGPGSGSRITLTILRLGTSAF